jgi:hypothetical protein
MGKRAEPPSVAGFAGPDESLLALIISHPQLDHYGLAADLEADVPIYVGREAASLLQAASFFLPVSGTLQESGYLGHREPFALGPFTVIPFLNDHSAFDAYSLLVEANGQRLVMYVSRDAKCRLALTPLKFTTTRYRRVLTSPLGRGGLGAAAPQMERSGIHVEHPWKRGWAAPGSNRLAPVRMLAGLPAVRQSCGAHRHGRTPSRPCPQLPGAGENA